MKKQEEWGAVMVIVILLSIGILFSGVSTVYAAEQSASQQVTTTKQIQEKRMPSTIPLNRTRTVDLRCKIKAFYDHERTKPILDGKYDWASNPPNPPVSTSPLYIPPVPNFVHYDIIVENAAYPSEQGTRHKVDRSLVARTFNVKIGFIELRIPPDPPRTGSHTLTVTNLGPGESHVFSSYILAPKKSPTVSTYALVSVTVDPENKVTEESETNNTCSYKVTPK